MKILIIRFSSLGDILLVTPLIRAIKKIYPDSEIDILVKNRYQELLQYNKNISEVISLNHQGIKSVYSIITYINKKKFDIVIDLHNNIKSNLIKIFCNGKLKITYKKDILERRLLVLSSFIRRKLAKRMDNYKFRIMRNNDLKNIVHTSEKYFQSMKAILNKKIKIDFKPEITITEIVREFAEKLLEEKKIDKNDILIGFNPGGKNFTKRWDKEKYSELAKRIIEKFNAKIIIFGDKNDVEVADYIEKSINKLENIINVAGKTDLLQLASLIERCRLFVTGDTGPMHIANSFEVPVIAIFGPTTVEFGFYPAGLNDIVLCLDLYCRPCSLHGDNECPVGTHDCMRKINVDDVFKIVDEKIRGNMEKNNT